MSAVRISPRQSTGTGTHAARSACPSSTCPARLNEFALAASALGHAISYFNPLHQLSCYLDRHLLSPHQQLPTISLEQSIRQNFFALMLLPATAQTPDACGADQALPGQLAAIVPASGEASSGLAASRAPAASLGGDLQEQAAGDESLELMDESAASSFNTVC